MIPYRQNFFPTVGYSFFEIYEERQRAAQALKGAGRPSRQYCQFREEEKKYLDFSASVSNLVYDYDKNQTVFDRFMTQGWNVHDSSLHERSERIAQHETRLNPIHGKRPAYRFSREDISKVVDTMDSGYFGVCLINEQEKKVVVVNRGTWTPADLPADLALTFGFDSAQNKAAIDFGRKCKMKADELGYSITFVGHSLGGYQAHLQAIVLKASAIGIDNPLVSEEIALKYFSEAFYDLFKDNPDLISIHSDKNPINTAGSTRPYGAMYKADVVGVDLSYNTLDYLLKSHGCTNIEKEINEGRIYAVRHVNQVGEQVPISSSHQRSFENDPQKERKGMFEAIKERFANDIYRLKSEFDRMSASLPAEILSDNNEPTPLEEAVINQMAQLANECDEFLAGTKDDAQALHDEIKSKLKGKERVAILTKMGEAAQGIATEIYKQQQNKLARTGERLQFQAEMREFQKRKERAETRSQKKPISLTLPEIESVVMQGIHPSGHMQKQLETMQNNFAEYRRAKMELSQLLKDRLKRKDVVEGRKKSVEERDGELLRSFKKMFKSHQNTVKSLSQVSGAIGIFESLLKLTPASPGVPFFSAITSGIFGVVSAREERDFIKKREALRRDLDENQGRREKLAASASENHQEILAIEHEKERMRSKLLQCEDLMPPRKYCDLLAECHKEIQEEITGTEAKLKISYEKKDQLLSQEEENNRLLAVAENRDRENRGKKRKDPLNDSFLFQARKEKERIQEDLEDLQVEINTLEKKVEKKKDQEVESYNKRLRNERLLPLKTYFFDLVEQAEARFESSDPANREWREMISKSFKVLKEAREPWNKSISNGFDAIDTLFSEFAKSPILNYLSLKTGKCLNRVPVYLQNFFKVARHSYKLQQALQMWKEADNLLQKTDANLMNGDPILSDFIETTNGETGTSTKKEKMVPILPKFDATFKDVIEKFGVKNFLDHYLIPGLEIVNNALVIIRLVSFIFNKCQRTKSIEEMKLINISEFLKGFSEKMDKRLEWMSSQIDENHAEVLEKLSFFRSELSLYSSDIISEIEKSRNDVLNHQEWVDYNNRTEKIKRVASKLDKKYQEKVLTLISNREIDENRIIELFDILYLGITRDLVLDVNSGISIGQGADGMDSHIEPLVDVRLIARNPDMYTGVFGAKLSIREKIPSLYLFNLLTRNYLTLRERVRPAIRTSEFLTGRSAGCASILAQQGEILLRLCDGLESLIVSLKRKQTAVIQSLQDTLVEMDSAKKVFERNFQQAAIQNGRALLLDKSSRVGGKKFFYGNLFYKKQIGSGYTFDSLGIKSTAVDSMGVGAIYGFMTCVGAAIFPPFAAAGGFVTVVCTPIIGSIAYSIFRESKEVFMKINCMTIKNLHLNLNASSELKKQHEVLGKIFSVWLTAEGHLSVQLTKNNNFIYRENIIKPFEPYEISHENSPFEFGFELSGSSINSNGYTPIAQESMISLDELKNLSSERHTISKKHYDAQIDALFDDYEKLIQSLAENGEPIQIGNRFAHIKDRSCLVVSSNPGLTPLLFPEKLIRLLESEMEPERSLLSAAGSGFLVPSYNIYRHREGNYRLVIDFSFFNVKDRSSSLYCQFVIAEIDPITLKAFSMPTFTKTAELNPPNLNEFLIQAMYSGFVNGLGLPGNNTVLLGGNQWIAPSERPFPGFYKLWEKQPESALYFDSRFYNDEMQEKAFLAVHEPMNTPVPLGWMTRRIVPYRYGISVSVWNEIRSMKQTVTDMRKELQESFDLFWSYCRLISSADETTLRYQLDRELGIVDPSQFDSLFDLVIAGTKNSELLKEEILRFKGFIEQIPSIYLRELRFNVEQLKKER